jgi:hypothetical protein
MAIFSTVRAQVSKNDYQRPVNMQPLNFHEGTVLLNQIQLLFMHAGECGSAARILHIL